VRKDAGRLRLAKEAFAQTIAFGFIGEVRQPDGFDGDDPSDSGILGPINDSGCAPPEFI
jgi:hypothetical protein